MTKILQSAFVEASKLSSEGQDRIGRELLAHLDRLRMLRVEIDLGIQSLDEGRGGTLNLEELLRRARADDSAA